MRFAIVLLILVSQTVGASALSRYGVFNYADMCSSDVTGDWGGTRIVIMRLPEGDYVRYSIAEGGISVLHGYAEIGPNGVISFDLEDPPGANVGPIFFEGRMTETALTGRIGNTVDMTDRLRLLRYRNSPNTNPNIDCRPR